MKDDIEDLKEYAAKFHADHGEDAIAADQDLFDTTTTLWARVGRSSD